MRWSTCTVVLATLLVVQAAAFPREKRQAALQDNADLTPINDENAGAESERDRRQLEGVEQAKWGAKNALLGFVFGSATTATPLKKRSSPRPSPRPPTTTEVIPVLDRNKVTLVIPGAQFGSSLSLVIRTTKIIGSLVQNSAERYQAFLRLFRPFFRGVFAIKGLDPIPTTVKPKKLSTTSKPPELSNEIRR